MCFKLGIIMWKINQNYEWEALMAAFSWMRDMRGIPQDKIFHAEGDVAIHTKMVTEALVQLPAYLELPEQEQDLLFAAALLHDVEKRSTTVEEANGRITSKGHARKGESTARQLIYRSIPAPFELREAVAKLVRYHGLPLWVFEKPDPQKALFKASLEVDTQLLALLTRADILGRICSDQEELLYRLDLFIAFCQEQNCWGQPKVFASDWGRYQYFQKEDSTADYQPYEKDAFEVLILSALPGTGKDYFIKKNYPDTPVVSLDDLRRKNKVRPNDKKGNGQIIQMAKEQARVYLRKKQTFIWNATNITRNLRSLMIDLFQTYGAKTRIVYLEVPYQQLIRQNQDREFPIPVKVLEKMINNLEVPALWEAPIVEIKAF